METGKKNDLKNRMRATLRAYAQLGGAPKLSPKGRQIAEIVRGITTRQFYVTRIAVAQMLAIVIDDDPAEMAKAVSAKAEGWPDALALVPLTSDGRPQPIVITRYLDDKVLSKDRTVESAFKPSDLKKYKVASEEELEKFMKENDADDNLGGISWYEYLEAFLGGTL